LPSAQCRNIDKNGQIEKKRERAQFFVDPNGITLIHGCRLDVVHINPSRH
jgi:hypothetical protein